MSLQLFVFSLLTELGAFPSICRGFQQHGPQRLIPILWFWPAASYQHEYHLPGTLGQTHGPLTTPGHSAFDTWCWSYSTRFGHRFGAHCTDGDS